MPKPYLVYNSYAFAEVFPKFFLFQSTYLFQGFLCYLKGQIKRSRSQEEGKEYTGMLKEFSCF